jgi:RNA polymerase sigma factor (sigma-70 family)
VHETDGRGRRGAFDSREGASGDLVDLEEERKVILALQQGDRSAFATLYRWYGTLLFRQVILPRLPIQELAEDCLKDTFRTALERIETFRLENRSIFFWLRRIAANKAIDVHRRHRRDERLAEQVKAEPAVVNSHQDRPDRQLDVDELRKMVDLSMSNLNTRYAKALRMRLLEERTREECAEALEVSVGNFDVILHRAAKAFRKVFPP